MWQDIMFFATARGSMWIAIAWNILVVGAPLIRPTFLQKVFSRTLTINDYTPLVHMLGYLMYWTYFVACACDQTCHRPILFFTFGASLFELLLQLIFVIASPTHGRKTAMLMICLPLYVTLFFGLYWAQIRGHTMIIILRVLAAILGTVGFYSPIIVFVWPLGGLLGDSNPKRNFVSSSYERGVIASAYIATTFWMMHCLASGIHASRELFAQTIVQLVAPIVLYFCNLMPRERGRRGKIGGLRPSK